MPPWVETATADYGVGVDCALCDKLTYSGKCSGYVSCVTSAACVSLRDNPSLCGDCK
jgi:hypothetical protein